MELMTVPKGERLHIIILGVGNSGKSSVLNSIAGQDISITSNISGTTTDPVEKAMEIHNLGPVLFIDTAGFDDIGQLGELRVNKTLEAIQRADIALMVYGKDDNSGYEEFVHELEKRKIPVINILNKVDEVEYKKLVKELKDPVLFSAGTGSGKDEVIRRLISLRKNKQKGYIVGDLVKENDTVVLVIPQDKEAPEGRIILPQVQVMRELIDRKVTFLCTTDDSFKADLYKLKNTPDLVITDSKVFEKIYKDIPEGTLLTSFSVLFAAYKGDIEYFLRGAEHIDMLGKNAKILIAEACSHVPVEEDIGRVKIPAMLRKKLGKEIAIDVVSGKDFPKNIKEYDLIIHCGSCMFNRSYVLERVRRARSESVPMSNYGLVIAKLTGILDKVVIPE